MKLLSPKNAQQRKRQRSDSVDALAMQRQELPVYSFRAELLEAILRNDKVVLVTAATGSGKSTQIPAYFLDTTGERGSDFRHTMAVTQPRRVAAMTLAQRVAREHATQLGGSQVGYRVRFDDCTTTTSSFDAITRTATSTTQLIYVTDGMLLREAMVDPLLRQYSVIFLDEAHERSLATDILLGVVKEARSRRRKLLIENVSSNSQVVRPLQVVVMSATLQVDTFDTFFDHETTTIAIPGRQYDVDVLYLDQPADDFIEAALFTVMQIHRHEEPGDILVFLPGQESIQDMAGLLRQQLEEEQATQWTGDRVVSLQQQHRGGTHGNKLVNDVLICLLYAALPPEAQLAAFEEKPKNCTRKIILATNIAETSVTLPNIRYVVDPGKHKCRSMAAGTGMESLTVETISQAQASQRSGRAGRVAPGRCFRLYMEDDFEVFQPDAVPEILRVNLAQVVLQLKGMGVHDPTAFSFVTPPDTESLIRATKLLYALQALDSKMELTSYGRLLARLPLDPVFGHLLLQSTAYECTREMLTAVAVLSAETIFYRPPGNQAELAQKAAQAHRRFASHEGDLPSFVNVYQAWRKEAEYNAKRPYKGGRSKDAPTDNNNNNKSRTNPKLSHGEWCLRNFISGRSLVRAFNVRQQLAALCARPTERNGLGMDVNLSKDDDPTSLLKCTAAGLFLQAATRIKVDNDAEGDMPSRSSKGRSGTLASRGRFRTKIGGTTVAIHPTSALFGRNPAPACVVYTEMVTTTKTYIRGVTQIREEWLHEVAPSFYSSTIRK